MPTDIPLGAPIWVDTNSTDLETDLAFYTDLFGWRPLRFGEEFADYTDLFIGDPDAGGKAVGGIMPNSSEFLGDIPSRWTVHFHAADCEAATAQAEKLGGEVLVPAARVGDNLVYSIMADPAGAVFGIFQPLHDEMSIQAFGVPGAPMWFEYGAERLAGPVEYYRELFDWELNTPPETGAGEPLAWAGLRARGADDEFGGSHIADEVDRGYGARWAVSFLVDSAGEAADRATGLGGSVVKPPFDVTGYRAAEIASPTGAVFGVVSPRE
jgi:uncharacterized protein